MTRRITTWMIGAALALASPASATKYAGEFMKIPVGARAIGMGGAFSAVADDATAPYWNPAGMVYLPYREAVVQHAEQFGSLLNHDVGTMVWPLKGESGHLLAVGASLIRLGTDDIPITPRPGDLRPGIDFWDYGIDNDPTHTDPAKNPGYGNNKWDPGEKLLLDAASLYRASSSDYALMLSIARQRGTHWAYGANLKFVHQSIPDTMPGQHVTSFGAGVDLGILWMPTDAITASAMAHDLTTTMLSWTNGTREFVIPTLDTGVAFAFKPANRQALTWATDLAWGFQRRKLDSELAVGGQTWDVRTGLEYWFHDTFALRGGANAKDLTLGAGVRYHHMLVDYAASLNRFLAGNDSPSSDGARLDATHILSAGWSW
jgi:hypothetical protein